MKKPMLLLIAVALSIVMLSVMFPSDPNKPDIINRLKPNKPKNTEAENVSNNYKIININRLVGSGDALVWSPDEKNLYYSVGAGDSNEEGMEEFWMRDMDGNKKRIGEDIKLYNISNAKFSPDGTMLSFISTHEDVSRLLLYDTKNESIKDISPKKVNDSGVTSYDWESNSSSIIMSVDISNPKIQIYNIKTGKLAKLDMKLVSCRNVAYYGNDKIIYSDMEGDTYKIFSADRYGRNNQFIAEGWDFKICPDSSKIAILSDGYGQRGLWVYYTGFNKKNALSSSIVYNAFWTKDSSSLMYSIMEDSRNNYIYKGNIYYYGPDNKTINVTDAKYILFLPSGSGNKIAMVSPSYGVMNKEDIGIFVGNLYKQP